MEVPLCDMVQVALQSRSHPVTTQVRARPRDISSTNTTNHAHAYDVSASNLSRCVEHHNYALQICVRVCLKLSALVTPPPLLPRSPALVSAVIIIIVVVVVIVVRTKQQRQRERKEEGHRQRSELLYLTLPHALGEP